MNIFDELIAIMDELGIAIEETGEFVDVDSITFIALIIRIEETFRIVFPDDLLVSSAIKNAHNLETIISNIMSNEN